MWWKILIGLMALSAIYLPLMYSAVVKSKQKRMQTRKEHESESQNPAEQEQHNDG